MDPSYFIYTLISRSTFKYSRALQLSPRPNMRLYLLGMLRPTHQFSKVLPLVQFPGGAADVRPGTHAAGPPPGRLRQEQATAATAAGVHVGGEVDPDDGRRLALLQFRVYLQLDRLGQQELATGGVRDHLVHRPPGVSVGDAWAGLVRGLRHLGGLRLHAPSLWHFTHNTLLPLEVPYVSASHQISPIFDSKT